MAIVSNPATVRPKVGARLGVPTSLAWLALPALLLVVVIFAYPAARLLLRSFTEPPGGLRNYEAVFTDGVLMRILLRSVTVAAVVTAIALLCGYVYAFAAVTAGRRLRATLLTLVGASLFVSVIVRGYSWLAILDRKGAMNVTLDALGLGAFKTVLVHNFAGVVIGMIQYGIPFMVLAVYDVMRRVDPNLTKAAATLGARPSRAFLRVFLPLTLPGVIAGCVIVFITTLGYYILPAILGGPQTTVVGQVIAEKIQTTLEWSTATALSGVLLAVSIVGFVAFLRVTRRYGAASNG
jgi:ABC-type spermidine/putrescine transport system permease subunit I